MDCSTPGFPVTHHLLEFTQVQVQGCPQNRNGLYGGQTGITLEARSSGGKYTGSVSQLCEFWAKDTLPEPHSPHLWSRRALVPGDAAEYAAVCRAWGRCPSEVRGLHPGVGEMHLPGMPRETGCAGVSSYFFLRSPHTPGLSHTCRSAEGFPWGQTRVGFVSSSKSERRAILNSSLAKRTEPKGQTARGRGAEATGIISGQPTPLKGVSSPTRRRPG